ncbi:MAG: trypsin-like peptidase domain-containing protein [Acidobacteriota bacterium]|nr:trypsin-like peptidase domain-containing protein [Acidobacteriota bacterium]
MSGATNRVCPGDICLGSDWSDLAESLRRITVEIRGPDGRHGAGVVWTADGIIITNAHVVNGHAMIRFHDGRAAPAELVARSRRSDLAALRVAFRHLPCAVARDSRTVRPGEIVIAVGHPLGVSGAVSLGILHSASDESCIEADIRLAPGNSGGPLADAAGRVIGINTMVANGMGIAVSAPAVERFRAGIISARVGPA